MTALVCVFAIVLGNPRQVIDVTFKDLLKHPMPFNGKLIRTRGYIDRTHEQFRLSTDRGMHPVIIWLDKPDDLTPEDRPVTFKLREDRAWQTVVNCGQPNSRCCGIIATVTGRFDAPIDFPYPLEGREGYSSDRIVVQSVSNVKVIPCRPTHVIDVRFQRLLSHAMEFDGKMIRTRAYLGGNSEEFGLGYGTVMNPVIVWLDTPDDLMPRDKPVTFELRNDRAWQKVVNCGKPKNPCCCWTIATITGRFDAIDADPYPWHNKLMPLEGFGHGGYFPTRIVVKSVSDVKAIPCNRRPAPGLLLPPVVPCPPPHRNSTAAVEPLPKPR